MSTSGATENGGAAIFPNYAGSGTPEGVITATIGKTYLDTTNGALYFKLSGSGNTGWSVGVGAAIDDDGDTPIQGVAIQSGSMYVLNPGAGSSTFIGDAIGLAGTGNGVSFLTTGSDGGQHVEMILGSSGQFTWAWLATGKTTFPNDITITGKTLSTAGIGVGNSAAATLPGTVVKKMEVFDAAGVSLGFVAIYDAIT